MHTPITEIILSKEKWVEMSRTHLFCAKLITEQSTYLDITQRRKNIHEESAPWIIKCQIRKEIHNLRVHLL